MKPITIFAIGLAFALSATSCCGQKASSVELTFNYTKQAGPGSNQYAVWVENADREVVKTLFVTHFSALGRQRGDAKPDRGYHYRPSCVHLWVQNVRADELSDEQLDSFTGATPAESGLQTFVWDLTDESGAKVAPGEYTIWLEADLHDWTIKTFACPVSVGRKLAAGELEYVTDYSQPDERYETMVTDVKFVAK